MKRKNFTSQVLILIVLAVSIFVVSGFSENIDIERRLLCHAMGVDYSDGTYNVTLQIFKSGGAGSDTPIDPTKPNVATLYSSGKTISEALEEVENETGREVFLGHLHIIVFSKNTDFSAPQQLFDFCLKDKNVYLGVKLCLSDTTAKEIMETQSSMGTTASENYLHLIELNSMKGMTSDCQLVDFLSCIKSGQNIAMPVISVKEEQQSSSSQSEQGGQGGGSEEQSQGSTQDPVFQIKETALIKDGKVLEQTVSAEDYKGIGLLDRETEEIDLTVEHEKELLNVRITRDKKKIKLSSEDGKLVANVKLTVVAHSVRNITQKTESDELSEEIEKQMKTLFESAVNTSIKENHTDILDIWKILRHKYPKVYLEKAENLNEIYEEMKFNYTVDCRVE